MFVEFEKWIHLNTPTRTPSQRSCPHVEVVKVTVISILLYLLLLLIIKIFLSLS